MIFKADKLFLRLFGTIHWNSVWLFKLFLFKHGSFFECLCPKLWRNLSHSIFQVRSWIVPLWYSRTNSLVEALTEQQVAQVGPGCWPREPTLLLIGAFFQASGEKVYDEKASLRFTCSPLITDVLFLVIFQLLSFFQDFCYYGWQAQSKTILPMIFFTFN